MLLLEEAMEALVTLVSCREIAVFSLLTIASVFFLLIRNESRRLVQLMNTSNAAQTPITVTPCSLLNRDKRLMMRLSRMSGHFVCLLAVS